MSTKIPLFAFLVLILTACQPETDKKSILQSRSASNQAFKEHNIENIASYLTDDIAITTETAL